MIHEGGGWFRVEGNATPAVAGAEVVPSGTDERRALNGFPRLRRGPFKKAERRDGPSALSNNATAERPGRRRPECRQAPAEPQPNIWRAVRTRRRD